MRNYVCTKSVANGETKIQTNGKLNIVYPYDPAIALLGTYLKDTNIVIQRGTCTPMFMAAMSTIAKLWKEPRCPLMDEWIKKMCVYMHASDRTHSLFHPSSGLYSYFPKENENLILICKNNKPHQIS